MNVEQLKQVYRTLISEQKYDEAAVALSDLYDVDPTATLVHVGFPDGSRIVLPKTSIVKFRACRFENAMFQDGNLETLAFDECEFFGGSLTFKDVSVSEGVRFSQTRNSHVLEKMVIEGKGHVLKRMDFDSQRLRMKHLDVKGVRIAGFDFSGLVSESLSSNDCTFDQPFTSTWRTISSEVAVSLTNCTFESDFATHDSNRFTKHFEISNCTFQKSVHLIGQDFAHPFELKSATIQGQLRIHGCTFVTLAIHAAMNSFKIGASKANSVTLASTSNAQMESIVFEPGSVKSFYCSNVATRSLTIGGQAAKCESMVLERVYADLTSLKNVTFENSFTMNTCTLDGMTVRSCEFEGPTRFENVRFLHAPSFDHCKFFYDTTFKNSSFDDVTGLTEGRYRELKNKMGEIGNETEEARFASYEIEARMKTLGIADALELVLSACYFAINKCGRSIAQPMILNIAIATSFFLAVYSHCGAIVSVPSDELAKLPWVNQLVNWNYTHRAIVYTILNSLGPIRLLVSPGLFAPRTPLILAAANVHLLCSSLLWFFFIFGVRKRFRVG